MTSIVGALIVGGVFLAYALDHVPKGVTALKPLFLPFGLLVFVAVLALLLHRFLRNPLARQVDADFLDDRTEPTLGERPTETTKWTLELLRALEWRRFEELCVAFFQLFGFRAEPTRFGADGGVDINLYTQGATAPSTLVQCKAWNVYTIGIKPIRELRGVMAEKGVPQGIFVTTATFTSEARAFAATQNIALIDGPEFIRKINDLRAEQQNGLLVIATRGDFRTPTCPSCGVKMTARRSSKDGKAFWGCVNYPRCRQTFFGKANAPA